MNDPRPPLTDDELSSHLDGEGAPDLDARLAADPAATARLDQLRGAADAVHHAAVEPLPADVVDDLVARALEAAVATGGAPSEPGDHVVAPLRGRGRTGPPWLVAAVVLVLMAVGLGLVWSGTRGGSTEDTATGASAGRSADEATRDAAAEGAGSTAGADGDASGGQESSPPTTTSAEAGLGSADDGVTLPDLGAFETSEELRSSLADAFPASVPAGPASIAETAVDRCAGLLREVLPVEGDPTHVGFAQVGGETVLVYEFIATPDEGSTTTTVAGAPATTLTTAVRPAACDPLFVFQR